MYKDTCLTCLKCLKNSGTYKPLALADLCHTCLTCLKSPADFRHVPNQKTISGTYKALRLLGLSYTCLNVPEMGCEFQARISHCNHCIYANTCLKRKKSSGTYDNPLKTLNFYPCLMPENYNQEGERLRENIYIFSLSLSLVAGWKKQARKREMLCKE